ncbi:ATP-binding protein [Saccharibacillus brassicae]|uniref:histidine kinase n=1 Tax=Saccharibacillus brassicae TaxID=2583377 RepID=A0A4Y6UUX4_SACBS|nr:ATP-binding protein [Saccharibacillus brassicae]QDH21489.1 sensor histidine kinase KdpD [Saccharibacillus brassicae]
MDDLEKKGLRRGKLTLFIGAAPGSGKTQSMLRAAIREAAAGVAVRCAVSGAEAQYPDTLDLLRHADLPAAPERGGDLDVDALLEEKPGLVVVDRLEARNAKRAVRLKRYMDVETLLLNGIDVYAALNIGHVESLNGLAGRICGRPLTETVPDAFVEQADVLRIADAPPEEIMRRGGAAPRSEASLSALREMLFRFAAERMDSRLDAYLHGRGDDSSEPWSVAEKVMVAVGSGPSTAELLRIGRRTAAALKTSWIAVHVKQPERTLGAPPRLQGDPERNLRLAEELGAEVAVRDGRSVSGELLRFAERHHIRQILVGETLRPRRGLRLRRTLAEELVRGSRGIQIRVVPAAGSAERPDPGSRLAKLPPGGLPGWASYVLITLLTAAMTAVLLRYAAVLEIVNIALIYLFPVLLFAVYGGLGPSLFAAGASVLALDFFFVAPQLSFTVSDLRYLISFGVYLSVAALTASLAGRLKQQLLHARQREEHTASLYAFSRQIGAVSDVSSLLDGMARQLSQTIGAETSVYLPDEDGRLRRVHASGGFSDHGDGGERAREEDVVAGLVFGDGEAAGRGSNTLRELPGRYMPLRTEERTYGVLAVRLPKRGDGSDAELTGEQQRLLEALCDLAAAAIARFKLAEEAKLAHLTAESERLRTAILDSVSHELRTPLATIVGSATGLIDNDDLFSREDRMELLETIRSGAMRMNRLVQNLLGMVRLESGMLTLRREWCDVQDLIGVSLAQIRDIRGSRELSLRVPDDLPMVRGDEVLLEQVLGNVLGNAIKYGPDGSTIGLEARAQGGMLILSVSDEGPGIPEGERQRVFEKFYRSDSTRQVSGTGLGLAICKGIVDLHEGTITAAPRTDGRSGTIVSIRLPAADTPKLPEAGHDFRPGAERGMNDDE